METERDFFSPSDDPCPWEFFEEKHHIPEATNSVASFDWAHTQMARCLAEHPGCRPDSDVPHLLPTRVLDVGDGKIRLLETMGARGKYVALSHCWGDPALMTTKLTAHTLQAYQTDIPFDSLPQTFRDAIVFVRQMGIQYLWIDTFCIIQEDPAKDSPADRDLSRRDWNAESCKMCYTYKHSHLTLAAASASGSTGGLFFQPKTVEFRGTDVDRGPYRIWARKEINHFPGEFPLLNRGWVIQEVLLSPRTLFCGKDELLWHCREGKACQCSTGPNDGMATAQDYVKFPKPDGLGNLPLALNLVETWHEIVGRYSMTKLTYPSDKLMAIDGLAQFLRPFKNSEYLAGLWSDSLALDMLWRVDTLGLSSSRTVQSGATTPRKTKWSSDRWLFPTWSWASVTGRIVWWSIDRLGNCPDEAFLARRVHKSLMKNTGQRNSQTAGNTRVYELEIRGVLVPSTLATVRTPLNGSVTYYPDYSSQEGDISPDTKVYCLRMLRLGEEYRSIVLLCVDEAEGVYERIGLLDFRDKLKGRYRLPDRSDGPFSWPQQPIEGLPPWWGVGNGGEPRETIVRII